MAKRKKVTKKIGGPFLAAAVFCENVIDEKDGMISVVRIVDGCSISINEDAPPDFPSKANPIRISQSALIVIRTGDSPGKHNLKLIVQSPPGKRKAQPVQEVNLTPEQNGGANVKINAILEAFSPGMFWFDVYIDGKRVTRMPYNLQIKRVTSTAPSPKKARA